MNKPWSVGVDIGGTFTDVVVANPSTSELHHLKVPSSREDIASGVIAGLEAMEEEVGITPDQLRLLLHGTTVATNAIIERRLAKTALVTTLGFRDVLEIGRHWRHELYDPFFDQPEPLVSRELRFEARERLDGQGAEVEPLDRQSAQEVVDRLREADVEAVAVVFLHSYRNPRHEEEMSKRLRLSDGWFVCGSAELSRELREYERSSTTVLNAALMPLIDDYLTQLEQRLQETGVTASLFVTQSNGGALTPRVARDRPVNLALSGPVAGVNSCVQIGRHLKRSELIGFDMGGTSTDVSIISDYEPRVQTQIMVGELPIRLPSVEIRSVGAGGGSTASVDGSGALKVGPESAGADPGPACYGKGGTRPTVTDCQLVLGRLAQDRPLGGRLQPQVDLARRAVDEHVAAKLGMSIEEAAAGVIEVANAAMESAVRVALRDRGDDPRDFALVAFGGAGPLHAAELARKLSIGTVIVPPSPGTLSALGLLSADVRLDFAASDLHRSDEGDLDDVVASVFEALEEEARTELRADGQLGAEAARFERSCDVRYLGQAYEVNVPVEQGSIDGSTLEKMLAAFHEAHERAYAFSSPGEPCELVTFRVSAVLPLEEPPLTSVTEAEQEVSASREVYLPEVGVSSVPIYERDGLQVGAEVNEPAVVHQVDTTTLIPRFAKAVVDKRGNLIISIEDEA
jgi:N-methylhydantoinase A